MYNIKFNEQNVSVFMSYTDLQKVMKDCFQIAMKEMKEEEKKIQAQKWLSSKQTAELFGVHVCTINRWKNTGYLTARTIGGRDFFSIDEINHLMTRKIA